jgi:hypothetical protein
VTFAPYDGMWRKPSPSLPRRDHECNYRLRAMKGMWKKPSPSLRQWDQRMVVGDVACFRCISLAFPMRPTVGSCPVPPRPSALRSLSECTQRLSSRLVIPTSRRPIKSRFTEAHNNKAMCLSQPKRLTWWVKTIPTYMLDSPTINFWCGIKPNNLSRHTLGSTLSSHTTHVISSATTIVVRVRSGF